LKPLEAGSAVAVAERAAEDDRDLIRPGDQVLLIVADDEQGAKTILGRAREAGFRGILARNAETGLALARQFRPDAMTLDTSLPDADGWLLLDRLKHDFDTRHIPVGVVSVREESDRALKAGAAGAIAKPLRAADLDQALAGLKGWVERKVRYVLVVEPDAARQKEVLELLGGGEIRATGVAAGRDVMPALDNWNFDCLALNLGLTDMSALDLLDQIQQRPVMKTLPALVYTDTDLATEDQQRLVSLARSGLVKIVQSPEQLLEQATLYLHVPQERIPAAKRRLLEQAQQADPALAGKKILIVDDDVRNVFALTSLLERHRMEVHSAESGREALRQLQQRPDIQIVLMDMMMPEMDGYEATRAIRALPAFAELPVIAITAKAMKGDREKCLEAGASDYVAKPIDMQRLLSLLRVWVSRR
jgi:CheY-like chemotaxis protein